MSAFQAVTIYNPNQLTPKEVWNIQRRPLAGVVAFRLALAESSRRVRPETQGRRVQLGNVSRVAKKRKKQKRGATHHSPLCASHSQLSPRVGWNESVNPWRILISNPSGAYVSRESCLFEGELPTEKRAAVTVRLSELF